MRYSIDFPLVSHTGVIGSGIIAYRIAEDQAIGRILERCAGRYFSEQLQTDEPEVGRIVVAVTVPK
jgi:hypothetical protein